MRGDPITQLHAILDLFPANQASPSRFSPLSSVICATSTPPQTPFCSSTPGVVTDPGAFFTHSAHPIPEKSLAGENLSAETLTQGLRLFAKTSSICLCSRGGSHKDSWLSASPLRNQKFRAC
jgi:hypothetical protein